MKTSIKVGDIMTRDFISLSPEASLIECAKTMIKKRVGSIILKDKDQLRGLITERDVIWALVKKSKKDLDKIKAKELGKKKIITIKPSSDIYEALQRMKKTNYRWLPVIFKKKMVGFLTLKDVLKIEPGLFDVVCETYQIREEDAKIKRKESSPEKSISRGLCEECGNFGFLFKVNGILICEGCKDNM